jgi:predicted transcriptional regulator
MVSKGETVETNMKSEKALVVLTLREVKEILKCEVLVGEGQLGMEIWGACAADLMSDVLAFSIPDSLLLTGLVNAQSVRTADVAEVKALVYIRGKKPDAGALELAREKGIPVLASNFTMYEACGRLYLRGLKSAATIVSKNG